MKIFKWLLMVGALASSPGYAQVSVKLGVLTDAAGPYSDLSGEGSVTATRMAVEDFNTEAKGIKAEVVYADHQNKPDVGAAIARRWFDQENVDVILDIANSGVGLAVSQLARDKDKLFLATGTGTSDLTGKACSPNTIQWTFDTYATSHGTGAAVARAGGDSWFFITADYALGHALERDTTEVVREAGGSVLGGVKHPINTSDFSSFLLRAQASNAKVIGLANGGADTINAIKQASEFGLTANGTKLAALLGFITDVHSLGLAVAHGLVLTEAFYWDLNDQTREFSKRFAARSKGRVPTQIQAGAYSATLHYLKAVEALKSSATGPVIAKMKATPTQDPLFGSGYVREDGRKMHDMYLFEVKTPEESKAPWDYYKTIATIPAESAFRPLSQSACPLIKRP
jgi:branched-chain amino acid transport system substrate-binding protein